MRQALLIVLALLVVAVVVLGVRTIGSRDETDAVDADEAAELVGEDSTDEEIAAGERPEAGTYVYTGSGSESVDALGGSEHVFPEEISVVVDLDGDDDCRWTSNVVYVKQHIERREYCTEGGDVRDLGFTREIEFFNRVQEATFECDEDALRRRDGAKAGDTWTWTCTNGDTTTSTYSAVMIGDETLTVGGEQVEVAHTRVRSTQKGDTNGTDDSEFWTSETGLVVKFTADLDVQTKSVLGDTRFQEQLSYALTSLDPTDDDE